MDANERYLRRREEERRAQRAREREEAAREATLERQRVEAREQEREEERRREAIAEAREREAAEERARQRQESTRQRRREERREADRRTHAVAAQREVRQQRDREAERRAERREENLTEQRSDRRREDRDAERARERSEDASRARSAARRDAERDERSRRARSSDERTRERPRPRAATSSSSTAPGWLRVRGPDLVDARDQIVHLRGATIWGLERAVPDGAAFRPAASERSFRELRSWGANAVVIPIAQDLALIGRDDAFGEDYLEALDGTVALASGAGLYVVIQLSLLSSTIPVGDVFDPAVPQTDSIDLWSLLAHRYSEEPAVLFDLFRAPRTPATNDGTSLLLPDLRTSTWRNWLLAMIGEIRRVHPRSVIFAKGANGRIDGFPLRHSDGSLPHNVIHAVVRDGPASELRALTDLSRSAPIAIMPWDVAPHEIAVVESTALHLARHGVHWFAGGWTDGATQLALETRGAFTATAVGRAFRRAWAAPPPPRVHTDPALRSR